MSLNEFLGTWTINRCDAVDLDTGDKVTISRIEGVGGQETDAVRLDWESTGNGPLFKGGVYQSDNKLIRMEVPADESGNKASGQISIYRLNGYRSIYGITVSGDPEDAGVWGAESEGGEVNDLGME